MTATVERIVRTEDVATPTEETFYNLKLTEQQARIVEALLFRTNNEATLALWAALRGALPGVPAGGPTSPCMAGPSSPAI